MSAEAVVQWILFGALGLVAVALAAGMLLTMSMYRAGLALMGSFLALAGLFLLLDADLPFAVQIMMNVGGMLVMILFMVMLMMDPGGQAMWAMKRGMRLAGPGAFAMHMPFEPPPAAPAPLPSAHTGQTEHGAHTECAAHSSSSDAQPPAVTPAAPQGRRDDDMEHMGDMGGMGGMGGMGDMGGMGAMNPREHYQMRLDMAMSTRQLPHAVVLGALAAALLATLVILTPWPVTAVAPTQDASFQVGVLLLSRYMVGFEGAAFLIVGGIAGAIVLGRRVGRPAEHARGAGGAAELPPRMASPPPAAPGASEAHRHPAHDDSATHDHMYHAGGDGGGGGDE